MINEKTEGAKLLALDIQASQKSSRTLSDIWADSEYFTTLHANADKVMPG